MAIPGLPGGLIIYQGNPSISPKKTPMIFSRCSLFLWLEDLHWPTLRSEQPSLKRRLRHFGGVCSNLFWILSVCLKLLGLQETPRRPLQQCMGQGLWPHLGAGPTKVTKGIDSWKGPGAKQVRAKPTIFNLTRKPKENGQVRN